MEAVPTLDCGSPAAAFLEAALLPPVRMEKTSFNPPNPPFFDHKININHLLEIKCNSTFGVISMK